LENDFVVVSFRWAVMMFAFIGVAATLNFLVKEYVKAKDAPTGEEINEEFKQRLNDPTLVGPAAMKLIAAHETLMSACGLAPRPLTVFICVNCDWKSRPVGIGEGVAHVCQKP
jgi:hypothetical protein